MPEIPVELARSTSVSVVVELEHRHDVELIPMRPTPHVAAASDDDGGATEARCPECDIVVVVRSRVEVSVDVSTDVLQALEDIANLAGAGHQPPDHGWENAPRPGCALCNALEHMELVAGQT
jgi:hypothetical protein